MAEKRGRSVDVLHLEEMLSGCTQLEVRVYIVIDLIGIIVGKWYGYIMVLVLMNFVLLLVKLNFYFVTANRFILVSLDYV